MSLSAVHGGHNQAAKRMRFCPEGADSCEPCEAPRGTKQLLGPAVAALQEANPGSEVDIDPQLAERSARVVVDSDDVLEM
eukprot:CAMPEP_0177598700 /NCGR_PEP_ID=MMETSP0419_2-20121207/12523_1 /TAXON_ID=582737 /ORGANISM="Tetraselmis sp., Strain GSL018" /LENGTH=79 /DNA_ID=CAMNT_0019091231 /DNA_START=259 /DNA_END=495 /DNA_ORIENTATION=+